eukprot:363694-Chlamydomonas_euryale.AAC.13
MHGPGVQTSMCGPGVQTSMCGPGVQMSMRGLLCKHVGKHAADSLQRPPPLQRARDHLHARFKQSPPPCRMTSKHALPR